MHLLWYLASVATISPSLSFPIIFKSVRSFAIVSICTLVDKDWHLWSSATNSSPSQKKHFSEKFFEVPLSLVLFLLGSRESTFFFLLSSFYFLHHVRDFSFFATNFVYCKEQHMIYGKQLCYLTNFVKVLQTKKGSLFASLTKMEVHQWLWTV